MPIYRREDDPERKEQPKEEKAAPKQEVSSGAFKKFISSPKTKAFVEKCHKEYNVTEAGTRELLYELYQRYGGDGDDDDDDEKVRNRAGEMLDVMKSVADKFALFKED